MPNSRLNQLVGSVSGTPIVPRRSDGVDADDVDEEQLVLLLVVPPLLVYHPFRKGGQILSFSAYPQGPYKPDTPLYWPRVNLWL
jgi:hypothetical protein